MVDKNTELRKKENILRDVETQRKRLDANAIYSWERYRKKNEKGGEPINSHTQIQKTINIHKDIISTYKNIKQFTIESFIHVYRNQWEKNPNICFPLLRSINLLSC
jgi:hypothetical protein